MTEDRAVAAFFDMDHTLLHGSTAPLYLRFVLRNGMLGPGQWPALLWRIGGYVAGRVAFPQLTAWIITPCLVG